MRRSEGVLDHEERSNEMEQRERSLEEVRRAQEK